MTTTPLTYVECGDCPGRPPHPLAPRAHTVAQPTSRSSALTRPACAPEPRQGSLVDRFPARPGGPPLAARRRAAANLHASLGCARRPNVEHARPLRPSLRSEPALGHPFPAPRAIQRSAPVVLERDRALGSAIAA